MAKKQNKKNVSKSEIKRAKRIQKEQTEILRTHRYNIKHRDELGNNIYIPLNKTRFDNFVANRKYYDEHPLADMHVHLDIPDSYAYLDELISAAKFMGVKYLAICDHNYTGTRFGFGKYLKENNIPYDQVIVKYDDDLNIIPAVEVSTHYKGKKFHLAVYGATRDPEVAFNKLIKFEYQKKYIKYNVLYMYLREFGVNISYEDFFAINKLARLEDPKLFEMNETILFDYMKKSGKFSANDISTAARVLSSYNIMPDMKLDSIYEPFKNIHLNTIDIIKLAHDAGGIVIWAHPNMRGNNIGEYGRLYNELLVNGLDGAEIYGEEDIFDENIWTHDPSKRNNLIISAGSDRHTETLNMAEQTRYLGHIHGIIDKPIYCEDLPIIKTLEELNNSNRQIVASKQLTSFLSNLKPCSNINYESLYREAKIAFARKFLGYKLIMFWNKYGDPLNNIFNDKKTNDRFFLLYFDYLTSGRIGEPGLSPLDRIMKEVFALKKKPSNNLKFSINNRDLKTIDPHIDENDY